MNRSDTIRCQLDASQMNLEFLPPKSIFKKPFFMGFVNDYWDNALKGYTNSVGRATARFRSGDG